MKRLKTKTLEISLILVWSFLFTLEGNLLWAEEFALVAQQIFIGEAQPFGSGFVHIRDDKIVAVEKGSPPQDLTVKGEAQVLFPGFVDAHSYLGMEGELNDKVFAQTPYLAAEDAFNPYHPWVLANLQEGLTSFIVAPGNENLLGGYLSWIQLETENAYVLHSSLALKYAFCSSVLKKDRNPTSWMGLFKQFRDSPPSPENFNFFVCDSRAPLEKALPQIVACRGLLYLENSALFLELPQLLKQYHYSEGLILAVPTLESPRLALRLPGLLEKAGFRLAFGSNERTRSAQALRLGANLAIQEGLSLKAAQDALTLHPAHFFRIESVGRIQPGYTANLILASDHPLNLSASIKKVFVKGKEVVQP
jgi:hypothetical protein